MTGMPSNVDKTKIDNWERRCCIIHWISVGTQDQVVRSTIYNLAQTPTKYIPDSSCLKQ